MSVLVLSESENEGEQLQDELEDEVMVDSRAIDERANVPVSVVTERFLRAIVEKVPLDRIEELHLFAALRQGTIETGIAVVAARVIIAEDVAPPAPLELQLDADANSASESPNAVEAADVEETYDEVVHDKVVNDEAIPDEAEADEAMPDDAAYDDALYDDSPYADEPVQLKLVPTSVYATVQSAEEVVTKLADKTPEIEEYPTEAREPRIRHTVYTARYRLIVKGPERGKWEMDVVDEADAPLLAVETVVRGVQRRAGEETATVRYDASQLARVLRMAVP